MGVSILAFKGKGYFVDRIEVLNFVRKFDLNLIQQGMCNESVLIEFELDAYII